MINGIKNSYGKMGAMIMAGVVAGQSSDALAAGGGGGGGAPTGNNFSNIAENITTSISSLPALLSALSYLFGILLGVLGVMKIKDHVENPTQTQLKDGAIRLAAGGALFALPILFEAMSNTVGDTTAQTGPATLNKVTFSTN